MIWLNKFYSYQGRQQMSRILSKKMNKTPVRSPSPDTANRNIIVRTSSPLSEALSKLRVSKISKSPLGRGFSNNEQYQAYINSLQERIKQFSVQNSILQHEIQNKTKEIQFLKEMNFNYQKREASSKSHSRMSYQPDLLSEYENRIKEMSEQVKRVHDILLKDRSTIEGLQKQNQDLRNRSIRSSRMNVLDERKLNQELLELENKLNGQFNRRLSQYQGKVQLVLEEEVKKINKVEREQRSLIRDLESKRNQGSPIRSEKHQDKFNSTSHKSPSSNGTIRQLECQNCKIYMRRIAQLEAELNVKSFYIKTASKSKSNHTVPASHLQEYLQKLEEIKMILNNEQVQESINHIENNLNDIFSIQEKFEYMKEQKNSIIQELRQKEIQQALEIVKLMKENQLFKNQIKEQVEEIQKLKELVHTSTAQSARNDEPVTKRKKQTNEGNILRKYIVEAIERIENLENQIGDTLRS